MLQSGDEALFMYQPEKHEHESEAEPIDELHLRPNVSLSVIGAEGKMTQGRATVTMSRKMACEVQKNLKPNQKFASRIGSYVVDVRSVVYDTDPLSLPRGASRKLNARMHQQVSASDRLRSTTCKGDIFTLVGGLDVGMQSKLRRAVSRVIGVAPTCVTVQKVVFKQHMPEPDPKDGLIKKVRHGKHINAPCHTYE